MMKKIVPVVMLGTMALGVAALSSCEPMDGLVVLEDYNKCVSYVYDHKTSTGFVDNGSTYKVTLDRTAQNFGVECKNVRFYDGATALTAKVIGMNQYFSADSSYVFMLQRGLSRSSGDFQIDSLRYGVVGNFWLTYFAEERYEVNVVPLKYNLETDTVSIHKCKVGANSGARIYFDPNLNIRYMATIDPDARTLSLKVYGQKFQTGGRPYEYILPDIPLTFNKEGYAVSADKIAATDFKGNPLPQFEVYDLTGSFATSFEGVKELTYFYAPYVGDDGAEYHDRMNIKFYNHSMVEK